MEYVHVYFTSGSLSADPRQASQSQHGFTEGTQTPATEASNTHHDHLLHKERLHRK
jgi:hypothetical protein